MVAPIENEVFVDCGAFDGDTIRSFLAHRKSVFERIYAIEPDSANGIALKTYIDTLPNHVKGKITILPIRCIRLTRAKSYSGAAM